MPAQGARAGLEGTISIAQSDSTDLRGTPISGVYARARAALLDGDAAIIRVRQSAIAAGGQSYDAASYDEASADQQVALSYAAT